ncbi:MAG: hypothetical protein IJ899_00620 [Blautia sp.]|nr:hypothetical protein [Blautia sp.]MBR2562294.1 hypothetical protein [Eubacterium sp.]
MKEIIEERILAVWNKIAVPVTLFITGMAFGFGLTSYKGLQSDNYMAATVLITLSYTWFVFLFWLNEIKDKIWE